MEESMIVGALETLNEEALEDALEEKGMQRRISSNPAIAVGNPLSPILSDTEEHVPDDKLDVERMPMLANTPSSEVDILYLRSLQNSPMLRVSAISLSDSMTDAETTSLGKSQNYSSNLETSSLSCSKTKIDDFDSVTSSPSRKHALERSQSKKIVPRPSSLAYDSANFTASSKNESSSKSKSSKKNQEKHSYRNKPSRSKSASKSDSSDTSTETEEKVRPKCTPQKTLPTPGSDADGFYSDDEHTPLVSPFHINRSSHYNLQSSKSEKESTPEKLIPKHTKSDVGPHRISRMPLERQFSIDSNLCDHSRPPPSSTSMVEISTPHSSVHYVPVLQSYGQDISDVSSPELQVSAVLESQLHNETVL